MSSTILSEKVAGRKAQTASDRWFKIGTLPDDEPHIRCGCCNTAFPIGQAQLATYKGRQQNAFGVPYRVCPDCASRILAAKSILVQLPVGVEVR